LESYDRKVPHIITICDAENARAYIRLNKRNYAKLGPHMLKRVVDIVFTENCKALRSAFDSVAGEFHSDKDKTWVVDVDDDKNVKIQELGDVLIELQEEAKREPLIFGLQTKNGRHIITRPFNLQKFKEKYPTIDVHRDNPTFLYCP
jgi:electron transfer flavoprotein alpha subunit